ncbi:hypothetical protein BV898_19365 [Hypsibius exemplaris]|uniref:Exosome complex component RRP45 n=1 Tax=Hypsibius exemplaris TaxID=2072580 RepID=A0A9X6RP11_HYPEX|nr:hypothetical protein BV898_19365 [Hypsibius exemplaris]
MDGSNNVQHRRGGRTQYSAFSKFGQIFQVNVSVEVIHADGNLFDATCLAVVACLLTTQRPEISVDGDKIIALSTYERMPIPLQVNHVLSPPPLDSNRPVTS